METTEFQNNTATELERIAWLSGQRPDMVFTSLMHHFNVNALWSCYNSLDGKKAVGADGVSKELIISFETPRAM